MKVWQKWWRPLVAGIVCAVVVALGASYVLRGDILFFTDVGRDFLIFDEISQKGLILIGPRTSIPGIFHGPLWAYSNMPAYLLGKGNPVVIGWWWVVLVSGFLIFDYWIIKKITNQKVAMVATILLALFIAPYMYRMTNPYGAFLLMPALLVSLVQYKRTGRARWLVGHIFLMGAIIQFEKAAGVPMFLITLGMLLPEMVREKKWRDMALFGLIVLPLFNYVIFELRHGFPQIKAALGALLETNVGKNEVEKTLWSRRIEQRWEVLVVDGLALFAKPEKRIFGVMGMAIIGLMAWLLKQKENLKGKLAEKLKMVDADVFWTATNYYVWFFVIVLFFNGEILIWHYLPVTALGLIALAIAATALQYWWIKVFLGFVVLQGIMAMVLFSQTASQEIGQVSSNWSFQEKLGETIYGDGEEKFGYFIYTPDVWAYSSKGMMTVMKRRYPEQEAVVYQKQPATYLIVAPFYDAKGVMQSSYWRREMVGIPDGIVPAKTWELPDGYIIEKYELTEEIIAIPSSSDLDGGFNAR
ncbi:hypothetical protein FWH30_00470 [Microgenomates group bacterium]|nr:hypothetical protein [Microgenomates group bacterium]